MLLRRPQSASPIPRAPWHRAPRLTPCSVVVQRRRPGQRHHADHRRQHQRGGRCQPHLHAPRVFGQARRRPRGAGSLVSRAWMRSSRSAGGSRRSSMKAAARTRAQILDQRPASRAALEMPLDRPLVGGRQGAIDAFDQRKLVAVHNWSRFRPYAREPRWARIRMRALCTCDFDVPSDTPSMSPTSLCPKPSTSCSRNAARQAGGKRLDGPFEVDAAHGGQRRRRGRDGRRIGFVHRLGQLSHACLPVPQHVQAMIHRQTDRARCPVKPRPGSSQSSGRPAERCPAAGRRRPLTSQPSG